MRFFCFLSLLSIALIPNSGCGPSGPQRYPVLGTVTFNGSPLESGDIIFHDPAGQLVPDAGKITAGKFSFQSQAGRKRVEIFATRPEGPVDPAMGAQAQVQYIPSRYNRSSELEIEVKPGGSNNFPFTLQAP